MANRRILSLWFTRLAAERLLRQRRDTLHAPFAIVGDRNGAQVLVSLNGLAEAAGLQPGQPLRDASAMCPALVTRAADPVAQDQPSPVPVYVVFAGTASVSVVLPVDPPVLVTAIW